MNIVYLIGNGFDLNLGMQTKYEHFYEYYLSNIQNGDSPHIKKLKNTIAQSKQNWSDLEEALGKYLNQIEKSEAGPCAASSPTARRYCSPTCRC